jgi:adenine specific DNA methylase Mod
VLFKEKSGERAEAEETYFEAISRSGRLSDFLQAFRSIIGPSDMMAYLVMMAPRLQELHRVLKPTGSIYLHCDPTASHYLKLLMDAIFGAQFFRNEIVWKRSHAHSDSRQGAKHYGRITDTLLYYSKGDDPKWRPQYVPYDQKYLDRDYRRLDPTPMYP